ncbi:MAG: N-acetylmuramoyl-L-alanine amidase [Chloroflexi bacterium]|nr:N-acetylmuramoyl-L-alanine amidase [Chloroflexota bacterium]
MALPEYPLARIFPSDNYNDRPPETVPNAIVLHATVGESGPSLNWLANPVSGVSVHYLVDRDGSVYQMVDEVQRAWHAGPSFYNNLSDWNNFSIGIEMVNRNDGVDPYDPRMVAATRKLCAYLVRRYAVTPDMIVTHAMISGAITGKSDPRNFPLQEFIMSVAAEIPEEIRTAAWMAIGISFNPDAAIQRRAKELNLGRPVTNELRTVVQGVRWAFQGFEGGILACEEGNWANVRKMNWM